MNKEWAEAMKLVQAKLKKASFAEGIAELLQLREMLYQEMLSWREILSLEDYSKMPYANTEGYHSKSVAYSIWHIMRIEDIVVNSLIQKKEEILFLGDFQRKTNASIRTTGNELIREEIMEFSKELNLNELYAYTKAVKEATDSWLRTISYTDLKKTYTQEDKEYLHTLHVVDEGEEAVWLIDFWCDKDLKGLLTMPLSRHWIMHIEAANRIIARLQR